MAPDRGSVDMVLYLERLEKMRESYRMYPKRPRRG
jgi:hypothetical protein